MGSGKGKNKRVKNTNIRNEVPTYEIEEVIHVGSMNKEDKKSFSWEGHGLSVSRDPREWRRIAGLGGEEYLIKGKNKIRFLDIHELTTEKRQEILEWGLREDIVTIEVAYKVAWYDDEIEDEISFLFDTKEEALAEARGMDEDDPGDLVERDIKLRSTSKMKKMMNGMNNYGDDSQDFLIILYAQEQTDLDGVWWEDRYIAGLSAPRGVIFPNKLEKLFVTNISSSVSYE